MRLSSWRLRRAATLSPDGREVRAARRTGRCWTSRAACCSGLAAGTAAAVEPGTVEPTAAGPVTAGGLALGGGSTQEVDPAVGGLGRDGVIGFCADAATPTVNTASNTDPPNTPFIANPTPNNPRNRPRGTPAALLERRVAEVRSG